MLCQKCKEKQATVHFVKIINGVKAEMHLCEKCAPLSISSPNLQQETPSINSFDITVSDIINSFFSENIEIPSAKCKTCGTTFNGFSQTGKLGCSDCYDAFGDQLRNPLKRIHGSAKHVGEIPKRAGDGVDKVTKLKKQLEASIASEDFENAAIIRDEIRKTEGGGSI